MSSQKSSWVAWPPLSLFSHVRGEETLTTACLRAIVRLIQSLFGQLNSLFLRKKSLLGLQKFPVN
jgi:hypothetical protein